MHRIIKHIILYLSILFHTMTSSGQNSLNETKITSRHYYSKAGFCSNSIIINSNQTYTSEGGCEGRSNVHFGRWIEINDTTLQLLPNDIDVINSIFYQNDTIRHGCRSVKFRIIDITGAPIYSFDVTVYKPKIKTNNSNNWLIRNPIYEGEQTFETDDSGFLELNYSSFDSVEFSSLRPYQNNKVKYALKSMEDKTVVLKLNANGIAFAYPEIEFRKNEKLVTINLRKKSIAIKYDNETWILNED